ncbi:MAG: alginate export family protein [Chthonomonadales bacterium]
MKCCRKMAAFGAALLTAAGARAQQQPGISLGRGLRLMGEWRLRYEARDAANFASRSGDSPKDELSRMRLGLLWEGANKSRIFIEPQWAYQNPHGGPGPTSIRLRDVDVLEGYASMVDHGRIWKIGRQTMKFGDSRLVGNLEWGNTGRSFDGIRLTLSDRHTSTDLFVMRLGLAPGKTNEPMLAGLYSVARTGAAGSVDVYALNKSVPLTATTEQNIWTLGVRPQYTFARRWDATLEAAYQLGAYAGRAVSAYAYAAVVGYALPGRGHVRISAERDYATGGDPGGSGLYRTFDQLFPTNHAHYGVADYVGWRNMEDWRIGAKGEPLPRLTLQVDGHFFRLPNASDYWYNAAGKPVTGVAGTPLRDPSGASGHDLGQEVDVVVVYSASKDCQLSGGWARFLPGRFVAATNGGHADPSDWFYVQTSLSF